MVLRVTVTGHAVAVSAPRAATLARASMLVAVTLATIVPMVVLMTTMVVGSGTAVARPAGRAGPAVTGLRTAAAILVRQAELTLLQLSDSELDRIPQQIRVKPSGGGQSIGVDTL